MALANLPPELLLLVTAFFTAAEATAPSLVCRSWHHVFAPVVWQRLSTANRNPRTPSLEGLVRNADAIRELIYYGAHLPPDYFSIPFTRLTFLSFDSDEECIITESTPIWNQLAVLVAGNHQLQRLELDGQGSSLPPRMMHSLKLMPNLQALLISDMSMDSEQFAILWKNCSGLLVLELYDLRHDGDWANFFDGLEVHPVLQTLGLSQPTTVPLLRLCPNLQSFEWARLRDCDKSLDELTSLLREGRLKRLDSLFLLQIRNVSHLSMCLELMGQLKKLDFKHEVIGRRTLPALTQHFSTLEYLSAPSDGYVTSELTLAVLESCPLLKYIEAPRVWASQIIKGKPWVCLQLRRFKVHVTITFSKDEATIRAQSHAIFERLSKLVYLTEIDLCGPYYPNFLNQSLDLSLESGLGQLSTLKRLTRLGFLHTLQNMTAEDVAWMKREWKLLETVQGRCNEHGSFEEQLLQQVPREM